MPFDKHDLAALLRRGDLSNSFSQIEYHEYAEQYLVHAASINEHSNAYWSQFAWDEVGALDLDSSQAGFENWEAHTEEVSVHYDPESFARFSSNMMQFKVGAAPMLATAAARALARWTKREQSLLGLAYHGRTPLPSAPDVSKLSGWLSEIAPIFGCTRSSPAAGLDDVRNQISNLPNFARSYGYGRYCEQLPRPERAHMHREPEACLNIKLTRGLSRNRDIAAEAGLVRRVDAPAVPTSQLQCGRAIPLTGGAVWTGESFKISWDFNRSRLTRSAVENMLFLTHEELLILGRSFGICDLEVLQAPWS